MKKRIIGEIKHYSILLANQVLDFKDELFKNVGGSNFISKSVNRLVWCVGYSLILWRLCVPIIDAYEPVKDEFTYWLKQKLNQKYVIELGHQTNVTNAQELQSELTGGSGEVKKREEGRELSVKETIEKVAKEEGFEDWKLLNAIMFCESSLKVDEVVDGDYKNYSVNPINGSMDRGFCQYSKKWNPHVTDECAYSLTCSTKTLIDDLKAGNLWKWNASKGCWGK